MSSFSDYIFQQFGVNEGIFLDALNSSPSAQGYIIGAISEVLLKEHLEQKGFEVLRIKEKPSGGNNAKSMDARGDFYIRPKGSDKDEWLVVESKGLKSNSEFRGSKLDSKEKLFKFLSSRAFRSSSNNEKIYSNGYRSYLRAKEIWLKKNKNKQFPEFRWNKNFPGPEACNLCGLWKNDEELKKWVDSQPSDSFKEKAYRSLGGPILILETHQPSKRVGLLTSIDQAAPLVADFNIMAVDLFLRTRKHEFVFMNSEEISHSPTSPEHLYQNYTIDILVKGVKEKIVIAPPWYADIKQCIAATAPVARKIDESQLDLRYQQQPLYTSV